MILQPPAMSHASKLMANFSIPESKVEFWPMASMECLLVFVQLPLCPVSPSSHFRSAIFTLELVLTTLNSICSKQRCYRSNSMCKPQSRIRRLFLPNHNGSILQVCRSTHIHSLGRFGRNDHLPLCFRYSFRNQNYIHRSFHPTNSLHPHRFSFPRSRCYPCPGLVLVCVHL